MSGTPLTPVEPPDDRPVYPLANVVELLDGRRAEWEARGSGPPLLWIEGGPGLPAHLARPDVELLADRYRAHLVNAPGCGRSSRPSSLDDYGLDEHVRYFDDVRRALGLGPVTVMAHSWGVLVALALALAAPGAVNRLILISGYAGDASVAEEAAAAERERAFDRIRSEPWFAQAIENFEMGLADTPRVADEHFEHCWPLYFADPDSVASREHIARLRRENRWNLDPERAWTPEPPIDLVSQLARIDCPTIVVAGEHDFICGPVWNRPIAAAIRGATYAEIAGVGHFPQYEAPDEFRRIIADWLDGGTRRSD